MTEKQWKLKPRAKVDQKVDRKEDRKEDRKVSQSGFSLIEVLVTLTLIALGTAFIGGQVFESYEEARRKAATIQIRNLAQRLEDFRRLCQSYPTSDQGLEALIEKPTSGRECKRYPNAGFIQGGKLPDDPWENSYLYESDGRKYTIISLGNRGEEGGEGWEKDISSDDL